MEILWVSIDAAEFYAADLQNSKNGPVNSWRWIRIKNL